jgi:hypothetical protein
MMHRKDFIQSLAAIAALQAIPASVISQDTNHILPTISHAECLQPLPAVRLYDILITPQGEAYNVQAIMFNQVMARVIDGDGIIMLTQEQAQAMTCHDWDDLNE